MTSLALQFCPAFVPTRIELSDVDVSLTQKSADSDRPLHRSEISARGGPSGAQGRLDVGDDRFLGMFLKVDRTPRRKTGKPCSASSKNLTPSASEDCAKATIEAKLGVHVAHEVYGRQTLLTFSQPEASSELL